MKTNKFSYLQKLSRKNEGIVVIGVGEPLKDWVNGIIDMWKKGKITTKNMPFSEIFILNDNIKGKNGRTDLVMMFRKGAKLNMGKMARWRIQFGDISWVSDFVINYSKDYIISPENKEEIIY